MPDWLVIVWRSVAFLIVLFVVTKILGKKQMSQLSMFEYVTGITIGNIGAEIVTGLEKKVSLGLVALLTTALIPFISSFLTLRSKKLRDWVDGKGTVIIKDGKVLEENLRKEKITIDEFLEMLRKKDVYQISDVEYAVLEAAGVLSVLLKKENRPLTPKDLNMKTADEKEPQTVIMDGEILDEPLSTIGKSRGWLKAKLVKQGVPLEHVFIGQVDSYGELTFDLYDDQLKVQSERERTLLLSAIKRCQAEMELFAHAADPEPVKRMYARNGDRMQDVLDMLKPILKE